MRFSQAFSCLACRLALIVQGSPFPVILTNSFKQPPGTDWSINLGVNSTGSQVTDGTAADGASHVQFSLGENIGPDFFYGAIFDQFIAGMGIPLGKIESTIQVRGDVSGYIFY